MASYADNKRDVVTIFGRKETRPFKEETRPEKITGLPRAVTFVLPNGDEVPVDITATDEIVLGRRPRVEDPPVTVDLENYNGHELGVSRCHAMIKQVNGMLMLCDLHSVNGTTINGKAAQPTKRYVLRNNDVITVGRVPVQIRFNS